jgi:hypothetical protein
MARRHGARRVAHAVLADRAEQGLGQAAVSLSMITSVRTIRASSW